MKLLISLMLKALSPTPEETFEFQLTDPKNLEFFSAEEHLMAARIAGETYDIDPTILLAIAWHESRYQPNTITKEPKNRISCGYLTPIPHYGKCSAWELSTLGSYMIGAKHLREWLDHPRCNGNEWCGIISYAGGGGLVYACRKHGKSINSFGHDACKVARDINTRSIKIKRALEKVASS